MQREEEASGKMGLQVEMKVTRTSKAAISDPDMSWVVRNFKKLQVEFPEKWVAAKAGKVVESDADLESLLGKLKQKHGDTLGFAIEFIGARPRNLLI